MQEFRSATESQRLRTSKQQLRREEHHASCERVDLVAQKKTNSGEGDIMHRFKKTAISHVASRVSKSSCSICTKCAFKHDDQGGGQKNDRRQKPPSSARTPRHPFVRLDSNHLTSTTFLGKEDRPPCFSNRRGIPSEGQTIAILDIFSTADSAQDGQCKAALPCRTATKN